MATTDEPDRARRVAIGEEFDAVIVHPNVDEDGRDPVAKVDGTTTYIRFPDKQTPPTLELDDIVRARMADKQEHSNLAVALEWGGDTEVGDGS